MTIQIKETSCFPQRTYYFALIGITFPESDPESFKINDTLEKYGFAEMPEPDGPNSDEVYSFDTKTRRFCIEKGLRYQIIRTPGEAYVGEIIYEGLTQKTLPQDLEQRLERVKKDFPDARLIQGTYVI